MSTPSAAANEQTHGQGHGKTGGVGIPKGQQWCLTKGIQ